MTTHLLLSTSSTHVLPEQLSSKIATVLFSTVLFLAKVLFVMTLVLFMTTE